MNESHIKSDHQLTNFYKDLLVITIVAVFLFIIASIYDFAEHIVKIITKLHLFFYPLDELFTVLIMLFFAFGIFSLRRWRELKKEIGKSQSQEAKIRLLAQTIVSAKDCISITDLDDNIIFVNDSLLKTYGYTENELIGKKAAIFHSHDSSLDVEKQILSSTLAGEWHGELINRRKDGSDFPIELWMSVVGGEDGNPVAMVGIARDITERKHAEELLRRREQHQALILRSLPMVFYSGRVSADMATTWISEQVDQITGFPAKQFTENGEFWQNRLHPDDREKVLEKYHSVFNTKYIHIEYRWQCADGLYRWFSDHLVLIYDEQGNPKETVGIWRDITENKNAEEELTYKNEQLRMATKAGNVGLWDRDLRTDQIFFSSEWKNQIGYRDDEITSSRKEWSSRLHPDDRNRAIAAVNASVTPPYPIYNLEFRLRHNDGTYRWILAQGSVIFDQHGHPSHFLGSQIDITERKQMEEKQKKIIEALREALESVRTLSGLIPICANCKKIRNDNGFWAQVEVYVMEHTDAQFSHGLCPDCKQKYLEDLYKLKK